MSDKSKGVEWNAVKMPKEFWITCEVCGTHGDPLDIEVRHRSCRYKAAFPDAYEEKDGMLFFDPKEMLKTLEEPGD